MNIERHIARNFGGLKQYHGGLNSPFSDDDKIGKILFTYVAKDSANALAIGRNGLMVMPGDTRIPYKDITARFYENDDEIRTVKKSLNRKTIVGLRIEHANGNIVRVLPYTLASAIRQLLVDEDYCRNAAQRNMNSLKSHYCPTCEVPKQPNSKNICRYCRDRLIANPNMRAEK